MLAQAERSCPLYPVFMDLQKLESEFIGMNLQLRAIETSNHSLTCLKQ